MPESKYHHGDLRQTLLDAALAEIESEGISAMSMRALARIAGVSATAPYRHFDSKIGLLAALAEGGFRDLEVTVRGAIDPSQSIAQRLTSAGVAYVEFAAANPVKYQIMFGGVIDDFSEHESLEEIASQSFTVVLEVLAELHKPNTAPLDLSSLGGATWSIVHGVASLVISNLGTDSASWAKAKVIPESGSKLSHRANLDLGAPQSVASLRMDPEAVLHTLFQGLVTQFS